MKCYFFITFLLSLIVVSCSDKKDGLFSNEDKLIGYFALTHIQTINHIGGVHDTNDIDVPAHDADSQVSYEKYRYDVLIFDEEFVTVRGDMPNRPKHTDYDDSIDGQIEYINDLNNWELSIGEMTDKFACPVGRYSIKGNDLIIGTLNMGAIHFVSDNEFTLNYKKALNNSGDYIRRIYTYTRIYSLTL